jgi:integrase
MRLFRPTYKERKTGRVKTVRKWWIELRDHFHTVRRFAAFTDKAQSEALGRQIERLVSCRIAGEQPTPQLTRWLEQIPEKFKDRLVKIGLIDSKRAAAGKLLTAHIADYTVSLLAKGDTEKYARYVQSTLTLLFAACKFRVWSDLSASRLQKHLAQLREGADGISARTFNFGMGAAKGFCRWMVRDKRVSESPLEHLQALNERTDRRRERRPLEVDEIRCLLEGTRAAPERFGMTGYERALLYRLAVETGLRASELRSLKVGSFGPWQVCDHCPRGLQQAQAAR